MRRSELRALDVSDVDMIKMEIRLKPTSKRSNRLLFFDEETADVLQNWLVSRQETWDEKRKYSNSCRRGYSALDRSIGLG